MGRQPCAPKKSADFRSGTTCTTELEPFPIFRCEHSRSAVIHATIARQHIRLTVWIRKLSRQFVATTSRETATKNTSGRLNKSAWIRSQAASLSAREIVDKAKAAGIGLSLAQVYTARSSAKRQPNATKRAVVATAARVKASPAARASKLGGSADLRSQFIALAMRIGSDEAKNLLKRLVSGDTAGRVVR